MRIIKLFDELPLIVARWSSRYPRAILVTGTLLTIVAVFLTMRLELRNDIAELLPRGMEEVKTLRQIMRKSDGVGYQGLVLRSPNAKQNRAFIKALTAKLNTLFWEPQRPAAEDVQATVERLRATVRDVFLYARQPSQVWRKRLALQIKKLEQTPMIDYVMTGYPRSFFGKNGLFYLSVADLNKLYERLKAKFDFEMKKNQPGYIDLLGEEDPGFNVGDLAKKYEMSSLQKMPTRLEIKEKGLVYNAMLIRPSGRSTDIAFSQLFIGRLNEMIAALKPAAFYKGLRFQHVGDFSTNKREFESVSRDIFKSLGVTVLLLALLLLLFFRRLRSLFLIPIPLVMGTLWTFAMAWVCIGFLTTATSFIGALLLGLGIDYGIYLLKRYNDERKLGCSFQEALERCYRWTGKAIATAAFTTAVAFFALLVSRFTGFSQFGLIAGLGVLLCLLAMHTVLPALLALTETRKPMEPAKPLFQFPSSWAKRSFPLATPLVLLSMMLIGASFYYVPQVSFESNMKKLGFRQTSVGEEKEPWKRFSQVFSESQMSPIIFMANSYKDAKLLQREVNLRLKRFNARTKAMPGAMTLSGISAVSLIPEQQVAKRKIFERFQRLLKQYDVDALIEDPKKSADFKRFRAMLQAKPFGLSDLPMNLQRDLIVYSKDRFDKVNGYFLAVYGKAAFDTDFAYKAGAALQGIQINGHRYSPSGQPVIVGALMHVVKVDSVFAILASLLTLTLLVFLDLRSIKLTLFSLWPLAMGLLSMSIILVIFELRLNLFNMMVLPALLGIGVDGGVHMLHRYRERPDLGVTGVQLELLGSISVASLTTVFSFASMLTAEHVGVRSCGEIAVIGLVACLVGSLALLPALMQLVFRGFPLKKSLHEENNESSSSNNRFDGKSSSGPSHRTSRSGRSALKPRRRPSFVVKL